MDRRALTAAVGIGAATAAAVALWAALRGLQWQGFQAQLRALDWRWLVIAILFDISSYALQGLRWRLLLPRIGLGRATRAIYVGLFCNEVIPFRPGEAVRAWLVARDLDTGILDVAPTLLAERLMDAFWLAGGLLWALASAPLPAPVARSAWAVAGLAGSFLLFSMRLGRSRFTLLRQISSGLRNRRALVASGAPLLGQGLAFWAVTRSCHLHLAIAAAFVVMLVVRVGTLIPAAPANLGVHQFATVLGLSLYGVQGSAAAGFALVVFVVLTAPLLMIGFAACLHAGLNWRGLRSLAHQSLENRRNRTISTKDTKMFTSPTPLTVPRK